MSHDILSLYQDMGLAAKQKTATEWAGSCPSCGGNDRFCIWGGGQGKHGLGRYFCRGCGRSGDAIQFLRDFQNLGYGEACHELGLTPAAPSGARTPVCQPVVEPTAPAWTPKTSERPNAKWQAQAQKLIRWAEHQLQNSPDVLAWLAAERGLKATTAARFHVGWLPEDLYRDRTAWGLPQEFKPNGKRRMLWLPHGLVLPVLDDAGRPARIKFRRPSPRENEPKYLYLPSEPKNTAPLVITGTAAAWIVVESELDGLLLAQEAGDMVNVLALGSASLRPDAEAHARLESAPFILVALDADDAGDKAAWTWWATHYPPEKIRVWPVPEGKDPTDAWRAGWDLRAWIEGGLPPACLPAHPVKNAAPAPGLEPTGQDGNAHVPDSAEAPPTIATSKDDDMVVIAPPALPTTSRHEPRKRLSRPRNSKPTPDMVRAYKAGRRWILPHLDELLAHGWTRPGLFRAGRFRYPCGEWGLAWASAWINTLLGGVTMAEDGTVVFELNETGRVVRQTARPR
ncbi:zinc finger CHC2-family protein [Solidesulfovibrio fructosivorans JJ]]|uniref:Zinc finger CHC2-family protein n=1 Tax=Solidesulfovibrio fructosivorans JJ] TaxID=596151 RepID=E1JXF2_SOLFR|nr:toprim domain-containing protein [Solidesulfovibrio fructosivorans]EFL50929.1 zinc finger CHC2-family protein [Solidesulfovibrio fructosivorans JJ]]